MAKTKKQQNAAKLQNALVLFHFFLEEGFKSNDLAALSEHLKDSALEGLDSDNVSLYFHELANRLFIDNPQMYDKLLEYDHRIVKYTEEINETRGSQPIRWKYFQYLSLLFTEMYLDKYFNNKQEFLNDLNTYLQNKFNENPLYWHGISQFDTTDLNKLAFWNATGSGKTFLMHINIKQYLYYANKKGLQIDNILLITPNEDMSAQHKKELDDSNIYAELFNPKGTNGFFGQQPVQIIEITKFQPKDGELTVAVENFEGQNLVLVDEGHRGQSGTSWISYRDKITKNGFAFEYSATFGEAIGALEGKNKVMTDALIKYGKATLFDYSYKYFYEDGYGKDYRIMNMQNWSETAYLDEYLTAYILMLFEQKKVFFNPASNKRLTTEFGFKNPLAIFVGASVSARTADNEVFDIDGNRIQVSDVVFVLMFLKRFTDSSNKQTFAEYIQKILNGKPSLTDSKGNYIFEYAFEYLKSIHINPDLSECERIYAEIINDIFHSSTTNAQLILEVSKKDGEIGLRLGMSNQHFGLVYVEIKKDLLDMCKACGLIVNELNYNNTSLFDNIHSEDSPINFLIGSHKFTEGWNCYRVSLMGLMRFGQKEGSQIIQMFGRGVRLTGYKRSMKRTSRLDPAIRPHCIPEFIRTIERLNIFGVKANYIDMFNNYLNEYGLPTSLSDYEEYEIKTTKSLPQSITLKYIKTDPTFNFKQEVIVDPFERTLLDAVINSKVVVDRRPKIAVIASGNQEASQADKNEGKLTDKHLNLLNWTKIYFAIERYKNEKTWNNISLKRQQLRNLMFDNRWYTLYIPKAIESGKSDILGFNGNYAEKIGEWEDIVIALLKQYINKVYAICRGRNECLHQKVEELTLNDSNFYDAIKLQIHKSQQTLLDKSHALEETVNNNRMTDDIDIYDDLLGAIRFDQHLYNPIMYMSKNFNNEEPTSHDKIVKISPLALNDGEQRFLKDLREFLKEDEQRSNSLLKDIDVYVLRNASRKGIGFFEASGFYPDFILWLVKGKVQRVVFIDPKGIVHLRGMDDEKVQLFKKLQQDIRPQIKDPNILLDSYILSDTDYQQVSFWSKSYGKYDFRKNHILFMDDPDYIGKLIKSIIGR